LRGKSSELIDARSRLFEAPGEQERSSHQPHQLRRAEHQFIAMLLMQAQQQDGVLLAEQVLKAEVLQEAHRHFIFFGQQSLFKSGLPILLGAKPLASASMPRAPGRPGFVVHQLRQGRENLQPVGVFPRLDKCAQRV